MTEQYVFVLGGTKCGTSSLYRYLGDHPAITPSLQKQSNFFLNSIPASKNTERGLESTDTHFKTYFPKPVDENTASYLDVSPDYLCSSIALENLKKFAVGKRCTFFIVIRDPIKRLISWYRFGQLIDLVPLGMSFEDFVENQSAKKGNAAFQAMETGRFVPFLDKWMGSFSDNSVHYVYFDNLSTEPGVLMTSMAKKVGIDPDFYQAYNFRTHNKTQAAKLLWLQSGYVKFQVATKKLVLRSNMINKLAEPVFRLGAKTYRKLNTHAPSDVVIDDRLREKLRIYYSAEVGFLQNTEHFASDKN